MKNNKKQKQYAIISFRLNAEEDSDIINLIKKVDKKKRKNFFTNILRLYINSRNNSKEIEPSKPYQKEIIKSNNTEEKNFVSGLIDSLES